MGSEMCIRDRPEIERIKAREAGLAAVGGAVLGPLGAGALPTDLGGVGAPAEQD